MAKSETLDPRQPQSDTDEILAWRARQPRARSKDPLATAFTAGSTAVFFILAACVTSAVVFYYQGH